MYKVASDKKQRVLHQGRPVDWVNGVEHMTAEDRFRQKKDEIKLLQQKIDAATGAERKELGRQKFALQDELTELRKLVGKEKIAFDGFEDVFVQIAKELVSPVLLKAITAATLREMERRRKEAASLSQAQSTTIEK